MTNTILIIVIVIAAVVIAAVGYAVMRRKRSERLKERFGPEYDRSVSNADDRSEAESELRQREKRHREMKLHSLDRAQRDEFERRWTDVQQDFVDSPARAVHNADGLVADVMTSRGYPEAGFDQRADDLSVSYPGLTQHYREARRISRANADGEATTEDLRQAVTTYRSLVVALMRDGEVDERHDDERGADPHKRDHDRRDHDRRDHDRRDADRDDHRRETPSAEEVQR